MIRLVFKLLFLLFVIAGCDNNKYDCGYNETIYYKLRVNDDQLKSFLNRCDQIKKIDILIIELSESSIDFCQLYEHIKHIKIKSLGLFTKHSFILKSLDRRSLYIPEYLNIIAKNLKIFHDPKILFKNKFNLLQLNINDSVNVNQTLNQFLLHVINVKELKIDAPISSIPVQVKSLHGLEYLAIKSDKLKSISIDFKGMKSLRVIDLVETYFAKSINSDSLKIIQDSLRINFCNDCSVYLDYQRFK